MSIGKSQVYFDGHERPDVVEYRVNWAKQMIEWHSRMEIYPIGSEGEVPPPPQMSRKKKKSFENNVE